MLMPGRDFDFFNPYKEVEATRANLPHWQQERALYFVTFRQVDSIPQDKLKAWRTEYNSWISHNPKPWTMEQAEEYEQSFARKIEYWLDAGYGTCRLAEAGSRQIVEDCLLYRHGEDYALDRYTIAPNHVHVLFVPALAVGLSSILQSWKGVTSRRLNHRHDTQGTFWQKESYDHIVRNETSLNRIRRYIERHESYKT